MPKGISQFRNRTPGRGRCAVALFVLIVLTSRHVGAAEPTARELFALRGVDEAVWASFVDGTAVSQQEIAPLCQVLLAERGFRPVDVQRWADRPWSATESDAKAGEFFRLAGRVRAVERVDVATDAAAYGELPHFYECRIVLEGNEGPKGKQVAFVYAINVPKAWHVGQDIDEPVTARGVLLKTTKSDDGQVVPVFAARRVAWHPDTPLGRLSMDVGLLDTATDNRPLGAGDRECFYQMLAAVAKDRADAGQVKSTSAVALFNQPDTVRGDRVGLRGWARRITRIVVDDEDINERFGIDHYYQLEMFTDDSQHNPIVCCLRELPKGIPTGDKIQENVAVTGFMMKKWAYRGELVSAQQATNGKPVTRLAPLVIARTVTWYPDISGRHDYVSGIVAGCVFAVVFFFIVVAVRRSERWDGAVRRDRS